MRKRKRSGRASPKAPRPMMVSGVKSCTVSFVRRRRE
jgi:hypothetical protein